MFYCQQSFSQVDLGQGVSQATNHRDPIQSQTGFHSGCCRRAYCTTSTMEGKNIKLHYLNIRGYGEIARLLFAYSGTEYEDVRYEEKGDWLDHKTSMPLHHVPVLEIDGVQRPQSLAIWHFLAKKVGLYPASPEDQMIVDTVSMIQQDLTVILVTFYFLEDGPERDKAVEASYPQSLRYLDYLEGLLAKAGTGYFVEGRLTVADIVLFDILTGMNRHVVGPLTPGGLCEIADLKDRYPWMAKCLDNVMKDEKIAAYVKSRKPSVY